MVKREIGPKLNTIVQNARNIEVTVDALVDWAISQGKLFKLVVGASRRRSENPKLCKFIDQTFLQLLDVNSDLISSALVESLATTLNLINNFPCVLDCLSETDQGILDNIFKDVEIIRDEEVYSSVKWLIILNLLLNIYGDTRKSGKNLYVVEFVNNLRFREEEVSSSLRNELKIWLESLPESIQPFEPFPKGTNVLETFEYSQLEPQKLYGYFLVVIDYPEETSSQTDGEEKFPVRTYLLTRIGKEGEYSRLQEFDSKMASSDISLAESQEEVLDGTRPGAYYTLSEIKKNIDSWAGKVANRLIALCCKLREKDNPDYIPKLSPSPILALEIFLPFNCLIDNYLNDPVDKWPVLSTGYSPRYLGKKRVLAVRSSDRLVYDDAYGALIETWEWAQPSLKTEEIKKSFVKPKCWSDIDIESSNQKLIGLALSALLSMKTNQDRCIELFGAIMRQGIPIVIGARQSLLEESQDNSQNTDNPREDFEPFLSPDCLCDLDQLLDKVFRVRQSANSQQPLGHHLSVWCDEPDRLVALKARRLSA